MFDKRIIDEISKSKGYEIALLTTFNFEINYFERAILNSLYDNNVRNVEIFVDAGELEKAISESEDNSLNRKYIANPIKINSAFHPKVVLLLGEEKAKLIVGSANIKLSGYTLNNEVYNVFEYSKEKPENLNLINDTIDFFEQLNGLAYYKDEKIFKKVSNCIYRHKKSENKDIKLIQNLDVSVLDQLSRIIKDKVISIDIAVPYYDNELLGYQRLVDMFKCGNVNLYIQNGLSTYPVEYNKKNKIISTDNMYIYSILKSNGKKNFYHGKVFRLNTKNMSYILYGSSNCTLSALVKTYHDGGNIECNILEEGQRNEFDYFFNNFEVEECNELKCNILEYESPEKKNFSFNYGIKKDDTLKLYFSFKNHISDMKIKIYKEQLSYEYIDQNLVVSIDNRIADQINNIFDITITAENIKEIIRCWYFDIDLVENYRNMDRILSFDDITTDDDMEKYRECMELVLRTMALTSDEKSEENKLNAIINKKTINSDQEDLDEDEIDDNFIINKDIPDEYIKRNRNFSNAFIKSKMFSDRFYKSIVSKRNYENTPKENTTEHKERDKKTSRPATAPERKFERFMKNRIKGILTDKYIELVDYEHYKSVVGLVLDIINEYKYKEKVEGIFDEFYVIEIATWLIDILLSKAINEDKYEDNEIIILALILVLENHIINTMKYEQDYGIELQNKETVKQLDNAFGIREKYIDYIQPAIAIVNEHSYSMDEDYALNYIESLFGYKTKQQLLTEIFHKYGKDTDIEIGNRKAIIEFETDKIVKYFRLDIEIIKEISNYYINQGIQYAEIKVRIINAKEDYPINTNPIKTIEYKVDQSGSVNRKMLYRDGYEENEKVEHI